MKIKDYISENIIFLLINLMLFLFVALIMVFSGFGIIETIVIFFIWFLPLGAYMIKEYYRISKFINELSSISEELEEKYLIAEVVKEPSGAEEFAIYELLRTAGKSMIEYVNKYEKKQSEYRKYIETWVHEIKTPIASASLIIDNNKNSVTRNIESELNKIDSYAEQALYYSKINTANDDYIIKPYILENIVKRVISKNSRDLILKNFSIELSELDKEVYTDSKWIEFILNQIIGNSIKYAKDDNRKLKIKSYKNKNNTVLSITDNGIGIPQNDINKIFIKGFTGENGRYYGKSTGFGLYICKSLCESLDVEIEAKSEVGNYTEIRLVFPVGKHHEVV